MFDGGLSPDVLDEGASVIFVEERDIHNLIHTRAEHKLSPAARTGQAQSLRQVQWRLTGKPASPLPAETAGKGVPEKNPIS
jgi:hypothetical protein